MGLVLRGLAWQPAPLPHLAPGDSPVRMSRIKGAAQIHFIKSSSAATTTVLACWFSWN